MDYFKQWLTAIIICLIAQYSYCQVEYSVVRSFNPIKGYRGNFNSDDIGIKATFPSGSGNKVTVRMRTVNGGNYEDFCAGLTIQKSVSDVLVFSGNITNSTGGAYSSNAIADEYYSKWYGVPVFNSCQYTANTNSKKYIKNQSLFADWLINGLDASGWRPFGEEHLDVKITLTIEGDVKLSDIKAIRLPGISPELYPQDFIPQDLTSNISCANTTICDRLELVSKIPDENLSETDLIIQVHRGIWGEIGGYQENTIGAFTEAVNQGYYVLESDIMPYGITNWTNPSNTSTFATPAGLSCLHDLELDRPTNGSGYSFNKTRTQLEALNLKEPRSTQVGSEEILFFDELMTYAHNNDAIVVVDMKNLQAQVEGGTCLQLCEFQTQGNMELSFLKNYKEAIEIVDGLGSDHFQNLAIKTYFTFPELKTGLLNLGLSETLFNKVLWAPIIAAGPQWVLGGGPNYDPRKIQKFIDDWMSHNANILYYEPNFFNDYDGKTSVLLAGNYDFINTSGNLDQNASIMEYIYKMGGKRSGLFSGEPIEGRGLVSRWGVWKVPSGKGDRRSDQLFVIKKPYMKHAVITTDRPDLWDQLKD